LDEELAAVENPEADQSPLLVHRFRALEPGLQAEVQTEAVRNAICEEVAEAVIGWAELAPLTVAGFLRHARVAEFLDRAGRKDILDHLAREDRRIDLLGTPDEKIIAAEKIKLSELDRIDSLRKHCEADLQQSYGSPKAHIEAWEIAPEVWRNAFLLLAIKHREPGFVLDETEANLASSIDLGSGLALPALQSGEEELGDHGRAKVIGDDPARYATCMLHFLRALGGDHFDPLERLPDGHNILAAEASRSVLDQHLQSGSWKPGRGSGASMATLKAVPAEHKKAWATGPLSTVSKTFADVYRRMNVLKEVFGAAERMSK
jgi:hypothetical protein